MFYSINAFSPHGISKETEELLMKVRYRHESGDELSTGMFWGRHALDPCIEMNLPFAVVLLGAAKKDYIHELNEEIGRILRCIDSEEAENLVQSLAFVKDFSGGSFRGAYALLRNNQNTGREDAAGRQSPAPSELLAKTEESQIQCFHGFLSHVLELDPLLVLGSFYGESEDIVQPVLNRIEKMQGRPLAHDDVYSAIFSEHN